jgi:hypothetical protein
MAEDQKLAPRESVRKTLPKPLTWRQKKIRRLDYMQKWQRAIRAQSHGNEVHFYGVLAPQLLAAAEAKIKFLPHGEDDISQDEILARRTAIEQAEFLRPFISEACTAAWRRRQRERGNGKD